MDGGLSLIKFCSSSLSLLLLRTEGYISHPKRILKELYGGIFKKKWTKCFDFGNFFSSLRFLTTYLLSIIQKRLLVNTRHRTPQSDNSDLRLTTNTEFAMIKVNQLITQKKS